MNTITVDVKTRVVLFIGGGEEFISEDECDAIFKLSGTLVKGCKLKNGNWINFASIARIIEIEEFYQQFPKKRPEYERDTYSEQYTGFDVDGLTVEGRNKMEEGLITYYKETRPSLTEEHCQDIIQIWRTHDWETAAQKIREKYPQEKMHLKETICPYPSLTIEQITYMNTDTFREKEKRKNELWWRSGKNEEEYRKLLKQERIDFYDSILQPNKKSL